MTAIGANAIASNMQLGNTDSPCEHLRGCLATGFKGSGDDYLD